MGWLFAKLTGSCSFRGEKFTTTTKRKVSPTGPAKSQRSRDTKSSDRDIRELMGPRKTAGADSSPAARSIEVLRDSCCILPSR